MEKANQEIISTDHTSICLQHTARHHKHAKLPSFSSRFSASQAAVPAPEVAYMLQGWAKEEV